MGGLKESDVFAALETSEPPLALLLRTGGDFRTWMMDAALRKRLANLRSRTPNSAPWAPLVAYAASHRAAEVFAAVYRPNSIISWRHVTPEFMDAVRDARAAGHSARDILAVRNDADLRAIAKQLRTVYGFDIPFAPPKATMVITVQAVDELRRAGKTWVEVAAILAVSTKTMFKWRNEHGYGASDGHSDCSSERAQLKAVLHRALRPKNTDVEAIAEMRAAIDSFEKRRT